MEEQKRVPIWVVLVAALFLAGAGAGLARVYSQKPATASGAIETVAPPFQLGEIVRVKGLAGALILTTSPEVAAATQRLLAAEDERGIQELQEMRLISWQEPGGYARILGFDSDPDRTRRLGCASNWVQIRRLDGEHANEAGWVDAAELQR